MADIEEIQEYLWKNLIFHDYSLHSHTQRKSNGYSRKQERTVFHHVISFAEHQFDQYLEVELESLSPLLKNLRHPVPHMLRRDFWRFNDLFKLYSIDDRGKHVTNWPEGVSRVYTQGSHILL